jgi:predicted anti-sigma-YlaC factor YlaD
MTVGHETRTSVCERSREWVSLQLDGELSMLERRMLDVHLERCPGCRAFSDQVTGITGLVRIAEAEVPTRSIHVAVRRHPRNLGVTRRVMRSATAAAAIACAVAIGVVLPFGGGNDVSPGLLVVVPVDAEVVNDGEILRQERSEPPSRAGDPVRGFRQVM